MMFDPDRLDEQSAPGSAAELAADPEASHWAAECAWVPGSGYCRNLPCSAECLFRPQREAEAARIAGSRRQRRQRARRHCPAGA